MKAVVAGMSGLLLCLTVGYSSAQVGSLRRADIDWWDHARLGRHIDVISGDVVLLGRADGVAFVAVDEIDDENGERDGQLDYLFLFESDSPTLGLDGQALAGPAVLRFWHDGLRIQMLTTGENIELRLKGAPSPRLARAWGEPTLVDAEGIGLVEHSGRGVRGLAISDALDLFLGATEGRDFMLGLVTPVENPDPEGGGATNCARTCSVGCQFGTCMAACSHPRCGNCVCTNNGTPFCGCW